MFVQKSIAAAIILIFTFFCESHGLKCYQGSEGLVPENTVLGTNKLSLVECPKYFDVCFKINGKNNGSDFFSSGCGLSNNEFPNGKKAKEYLDKKECMLTSIPEEKPLITAETCFCNDADGCNSPIVSLPPIVSLSTIISSNILLSLLSFLLCYYFFK